ncbi:MAG: MMPL family transporter, partial [Myxococcales bacterium]|nr:MMPL family transporter [Myxococcales bacterium]
MNYHPRLVSAGLVLVLGALGLWGATHLRTTSRMDRFLPGDADAALVDLSSGMAESDLARTWIVTVQAPDETRAAASAKTVADALRPLPEVELVETGGQAVENAYYDLYFPRRAYFLRADREEIRHLGTEEGLRGAAADLREVLSAPTATFLARLAPEDPLLAFRDILARVSETGARAGLRVVDGSVVSEDGRWGVVTFRTRASAFDSAGTEAIEAVVERAFQEAKRSFGASALEQSSVHRFARKTKESVAADVTMISVVSTVGMMCLFLLVFRSPRYLFLLLLPTAGGMAFAVALTAFVFGEVHAMSLAFGAALMGVCVDYAVHLVTHHSSDGRDGRHTRRRVMGGVLLGSATTIAGMALMGWASFPGMRELAVFACAGVAGAVFVTLVCVPPWLPLEESTATVRAQEGMGRFLDNIAARRGVGYGLFALTILLSLGMLRLSWSDSLTSLTARDPELHAEEERVRQRVARVDAGVLVVATGDGEDNALATNGRVAELLRGAQRGGHLQSFRTLDDFLWSETRQRENVRALLGDRGPAVFGADLHRVFGEAGFTEGAFDPFVRYLDNLPAPLRFGDLLSSPMGPLLRAHRLDLAGQPAFLTFVRGADVAVVARLLDSVSGAFLFNQVEFLKNAYGAYRVRILELLALGFVVVFAVVWIRYRSLRWSVAAILPALLAVP